MEPYYEHAGITIYHGDCRNVLPELGPVDLVLTDPPYGSNSLDGSRLTRKYYESRSDNWDCMRINRQLMDQVISAASVAIVWGMNYYMDYLPPTKAWLLWDKPTMAGMHTMSFGELGWTSLKGNAAKFTGTKAKQDCSHPTQKALSLMRWCIMLADKRCQLAHTILDPFMGSGTTLVAAKLEGRQAIGIEISQEYCEIAVNRLQQEVLF